MITKSIIAKRYDRADSRHNSPIMRFIYKVFILECWLQFNRIPVKVIFTETDPYKSSKELFNDIESGSYKVYTKGEKHPIMTERENAIFRAVHDYYGHYCSGARNSFGFNGEIKAYKAHKRMFSLISRIALKCETFYQICYYFTFKKFAIQKVVIL